MPRTWAVLGGESAAAPSFNATHFYAGENRDSMEFPFPPHFSAESFPQQVCNVPYLPRVLWGRAVVPGVDWIFFFSSPSHLPLHLVNMMRGWRGCDLVMTWFSRWAFASFELQLLKLECGKGREMLLWGLG